MLAFIILSLFTFLIFLTRSSATWGDVFYPFIQHLAHSRCLHVNFSIMFIHSFNTQYWIPNMCLSLSSTQRSTTIQLLPVFEERQKHGFNEASALLEKCPKTGRSGKFSWRKDAWAGAPRRPLCLERSGLFSTAGHADRMEGRIVNVLWGPGDSTRAAVGHTALVRSELPCSGPPSVVWSLGVWTWPSVNPSHSAFHPHWKRSCCVVLFRSFSRRMHSKLAHVKAYSTFGQAKKLEILASLV